MLEFYSIFAVLFIIAFPKQIKWILGKFLRTDITDDDLLQIKGRLSWWKTDTARANEVESV